MVEVFPLEPSDRNYRFLKSVARDSPVLLSNIIVNTKHWVYVAGVILASMSDGTGSWGIFPSAHIHRHRRFTRDRKICAIAAREQIAIRHNLIKICKEYDLNYLFACLDLNVNDESNLFRDAALQAWRK